MKRSTDRILTTHAGSLPRPAELLSLIHAQEARKPVDAAKLGIVLLSVVKEIVKKQAAVGGESSIAEVMAPRADIAEWDTGAVSVTSCHRSTSRSRRRPLPVPRASR
jgi:5-methyltetrahydropteroyltriglutamate--homocysteine methyltransferase